MDDEELFEDNFDEWIQYTQFEISCPFIFLLIVTTF